jgi:hypothetical protein
MARLHPAAASVLKRQKGNLPPHADWFHEPATPEKPRPGIPPELFAAVENKVSTAMRR